MPYIFIDESGNFIKDGNSKHFVVASFTVSDPERTEKKFKKWRKTKFPKKLRYLSEVKLSHQTISESLRKKTLKQISDLNVRIRAVHLKPERIPDEYRHKGGLRSGHLYTHLIGELIEKYLPSVEPELRVFCDQRSLKGIKREEFKEQLRLHFLPLMPPHSLILIEMVDSTTSANVQIADWIAGALAACLNGKVNGQAYYEILKDNIISQTELFKESPLADDSE